MNTERDELEDAIARAAYNYSPERGRDGNDVPFDQADTSYEVSEARVIAEALIAAGYRKPRIITTVEALDALPVWSEVVPYGYRPSQAVCVKRADGTFLSHKGSSFSTHIGLPATVLYVPNEEKK